MGALSPASTTIGFPCAIFPLGYAMPIPWPRSQRGRLSSSQAEIHGTSAVTGGAGIRDSMGVPARFILEELCWVGVFSSAENRVVSSTLFFFLVGKMRWTRIPPLSRCFHNWCLKRVALSWDGWDRIQSSSLAPSDQIFYPDHQHCLEQLVKMRQGGWIGGGYNDRCFCSIEIWIHRSLWQFLGKFPFTQLNPLRWRCSICDT